MREIISISGVGSELQGVGRLSDGRAAFVPGALPGERVEIEIVRDAKRFCEARLLRVIAASPDRAASPCPHVARCGGCAARHMKYEATLELKRRRVIDALERIGGVSAPIVRETIGCATSERCRNKAEYAVELRGGEECGGKERGLRETLGCATPERCRNKVEYAVELRGGEVGGGKERGGKERGLRETLGCAMPERCWNKAEYAVELRGGEVGDGKERGGKERGLRETLGCATPERCRNKAEYAVESRGGDVGGLRKINGCATPARCRNKAEYAVEMRCLRETNGCATSERCRNKAEYAVELNGGEVRGLSKTIGCATPERCRNKAEYAVELRGGEVRIGPMEARSHRVLPVEDCLLQTPQSVRALRWLTAHLGEYACAPHIRYLVTRTSRKGELAVVLSGDAHPQGDLRRLAEAMCGDLRKQPDAMRRDIRKRPEVPQGDLRKQEEVPRRDLRKLGDAMLCDLRKLAEAMRCDLPELISVHYCQLRPRPAHALDGICTCILGAETMTDHLLGLNFELSPQSFFQVNPPQAEALYLQALEAIGLGEGENLPLAKAEAGEDVAPRADGAASMNHASVMPQADERGASRASGEVPLECTSDMPRADECCASLASDETSLECAPVMPRTDERGASRAGGEVPLECASVMLRADECCASLASDEAPLEYAPVMPRTDERGASRASGEVPLECAPIMPRANERCASLASDEAPLECAPVMPRTKVRGASRASGEVPLECASVMLRADECCASFASDEIPLECAPVMTRTDKRGVSRAGDEAPLEHAPVMSQANGSGEAASAREREELRVLDAYCGAGTITLAAAARGARCVGVEIVAPAIENARRNAERNGLSDRARFLCGDAAREIPRLIERGERFDAAILDPPRKGADAALLNALADAQIPRIAYVSCDPGTLARDVKLLAERGYALQWAQPVDMFPWTGHIEVAAKLIREDAETR